MAWAECVFENVFVKNSKYGGSNINTNTLFEIWSNEDSPHLYWYLHLYLYLRICPKPWHEMKSNKGEATRTQ